MTEGVYMTTKSLKRAEVFLKVRNKQLTQMEASKLLNLSLRHTQRLYNSFKKKGVAALASKQIGKPSNRQLPALTKCRVEEFITYELYAGFKPLFMAETLQKRHGITISRETTRQLMIKNGVWQAKNKKSPVIHQQRKRRDRAGELVQIDGSPHAWFEDRGDRCVLIVFIDDATGRIHCKFAKAETTIAYMKTAWEYFIKYGKPRAFYSDRHGIFRVNIPNCNHKDQLTQFGRAVGELEIELICANSPQAKGRVERVNATLQDRLVKELRMRNVSTIEEANSFLEETYLEEFNNQFSVLPACMEDAHEKIGKEIDLSEILCEKLVRTVTKNHEFQLDNVIYQIKLPKPGVNLVRAQITVIRKLNGEMVVKYKGRSIPVVEYYKQRHNGDIINPKEIESFLGEAQHRVVPWHHPWKQQGRATARQRHFYTMDPTPSCNRRPTL
jgi:hypothetical protein